MEVADRSCVPHPSLIPAEVVANHRAACSLQSPPASSRIGRFRALHHADAENVVLKACQPVRSVPSE
jgi:hypothetical protein